MKSSNTREKLKFLKYRKQKGECIIIVYSTLYPRDCVLCARFAILYKQVQTYSLAYSLALMSCASAADPCGKLQTPPRRMAALAALLLVPLGTETLTISLNNGWTWLSLNVEASDMGVSSILGSLSLQPGDQLKNQVLFSDYYDGYGMYGQLTSFTTDETYTLKIGGPDTSFTITGVPTSLPKSITLNAGW